ncbi:MAG: signal peptide peptidase SppA [FCB group bacterium]|nr:signal peptide peptidase SppA [FCB group bacterium]
MIQRSKFMVWLPWLIVGLLILIFASGRISRNIALPGGPRIGLVEIDQPIFSSRQTVKDLNHFLDRRDIDGILIRIETPGGAVAASQEIFEKVRKISEGYLPVVVSMGNVAASGGYYIAIGADSILANPGTATGSIGVIMGYPVAHDLMEKLGIGYQAVKSGNLKDAGSTFREVTEEDKAYFQDLVDNLHQQFVNAVAVQRNLPETAVAKLADGKVYSGQQALELGLIDRLGTFEDAIYLVGRMTGIPGKPVIVKPPRPRGGFLDFLLEDMDVKIPFGRTHPQPEYMLN